MRHRCFSLTRIASCLLCIFISTLAHHLTPDGGSTPTSWLYTEIWSFVSFLAICLLIGPTLNTRLGFITAGFDLIRWGAAKRQTQSFCFDTPGLIWHLFAMQSLETAPLIYSRLVCVCACGLPLMLSFLCIHRHRLKGRYKDLIPPSSPLQCAVDSVWRLILSKSRHAVPAVC